MLGITKLNTTAYHPQCDGMVERFNKTLKAMLRKHAVRFSNQWDTYLSSILWAYQNTPHESTVEKPSFLMFRLDLRSPIEAAYLNPSTVKASTVEDYKEKVTLSLSSARQNRYKHQYDRRADRQITVLVTGYSLSSLQWRQEKIASCPSLGKDHIVFYRGMILTSQHLKYIFPMMVRFRCTSRELPGVHRS